MKHLKAIVFFLFFAGTIALFAAPKWTLVWSDEFNGNKIDEKKWTKIARGKSDWSNYMSSDASLYDVKKGNLILRGIVNPNQKKDPVPYLTGGVYSVGKYSFLYGKIEIRTKLGCAQGAWPALWLLPDIPNRKWPQDGEIDLMEHLNFDNFVYQTVHSGATRKQLAGNPSNSGRGKIKRNDYNIYGLEWTPDNLVFFVNGEKTFTYPRVPALEAEGQWPFTNPFYILLDMQVEGNWVGKANPKQLPVEMYIDYVRVYRDSSPQAATASATTAKKKKSK